MSTGVFSPSAFGFMAARRRLAALFGTIGSLTAHLILLLGMGATLPSLAAPQSRAQPRPEDERARKMPFILVAESLPAQPADPRKAVALSDRSLRAAEKQPDPSLAEGSPRNPDNDRTLARRFDSRGLAMSPPAAAAPLPSRPPAPRPRAVRPEQKPEPPVESRQNGDIPEPAAEARHAAEDEKSSSPSPQPRFQNIGDAKPPGAKAKHNIATSARLVGSPSFEALRAKWGEYMRQVALQLQQACRRQESLAHRSFRAGVVQMAFGIDADGSIENIRLITADEGLLAERHVARAALEDAGPFPALTAEMQKDEHFKNIVVNFIFE